MKTLLVFRYFWPEAPHLGDMELAVAEALANDGHSVTVFTSHATHVGKRYAPEQPRRTTIGSVEVVRAWLPEERRHSILSRLANEGLFQAQLALYILRRRRDIDVIRVDTIPPFATGVVAALSRSLFRIPYVYHVMDVHPEMDVLAGKLDRGILFRLLRSIDTQIARRSEIVVTLSSDMASELSLRGKFPTIRIIRNFPAGVEAAREVPRRRGQQFTAVFTGNLGKYQGLDTIIEAAALLQDDDVRFDFYGTGSEKNRLCDLARAMNLDNVFFHGHVSLSRTMGALRAADLALLPLSSSMHRVAHPSKLPIYLEAGPRILAVVAADSEIARFVNGSIAGRVAEPGNPASIASAIRLEMAHRPDPAATIITDIFGREEQLRRWRAVFRSLQHDE